MNKESNEKHLPVYGIGPLYGCSIMILTAVGIVVSCLGMIDFAKFTITKIPLLIIGILILIYGTTLWFRAAFRIDKYVTSNKLCVDGVYSIVRNPCYSAVLFICTGVIFIANNLLLLILPPIYWVFMTILMKNTEEKWLYELYGQEYLDYCKRVNRCIPWYRK